jgi:antitoxin component YwqK of YwqJK toxin-antitoxin module
MEQATHAIAQTVQVQDESSECYICYGPKEELGGFVEPHPCKCKGSIKIHIECFIELYNSNKRCLACHTQFIKPKLYKDGLELIRRFYTRTFDQIKEEFTIRNGKKHGEHILYEFGTRMIKKKSNYVDGKLHGKVHEYNKDGILIRTQDYVNDKVHGYITTYYPTGTTDTITSYIDGKKHGLCNKYYANGNLAKQTEYSVGVEFGRWTFYYPNGNKSMQYEYNDDGKVHGMHHQWYSNTNLQRITHYDNGEIVRTEQFDRRNNVIV